MKKNKQNKEDLDLKNNAVLGADEIVEEAETAADPDQDLKQEIPPGEEITLPVEEVEGLKSKLDEQEKKAEEYLDGWQRARAEFANYKKRIARDHDVIQQAARGDVIKIFLDIADDLKRALAEKPQGAGANIWDDGIEIIYQKLVARLEKEGVRPMKALGEEFDPNIHEALLQEVNEEYESGQIIEVVQEGYWIGEKVLRPAVVKVAA